MRIKQFIEDNFLLSRTFVSHDLEQAIQNLTKYNRVDFRDFSFVSGTEHNGWVVPKKWSVREAKIFSKGKVIYDGEKHPLGVIAHSSSFVGTVSKRELLRHLHFAPKRPKAIPYHFRLQYRPWKSDWGFCVPKTFLDSLKDGIYEVRLKTAFSKGKMVTREFTIPGKMKKTMIFVAHVDHPGQANDDLSGCAVGITLLNEIAKRYKKLRYTYKFLLTQEIIGSVFYLDALKEHERKSLVSGLFLEMLGNNNSLHLQKSFLGNTYIDRVAKLALKKYRNSRISDFRESAGNDEIAFEAPGIEIPMPSISRWPYPEYHTSDDNINIIHESKLQESVKYLLEVVFMLEHDWLLTKTFDGLVSLANPKYDLYIDPGQIIDAGLHKNKALERFQYQIPRYLTGKYSISDIAAIFELDFEWLVDYFGKMKKKKLVSLSDTQEL